MPVFLLILNVIFWTGWVQTMMPLIQNTIHLRDVQKSMCNGSYNPFSSIGLLMSMLNFNSSALKESEMVEGDAWKILILDSAGQAVLSPVLKVNELRESGVTLYL